MNRHVLIALAALLAVACLTPVASAKGPSEASIEGPGLSGPLALSGYEGSGTLGAFLQSGGFFPSVFRHSPDPMRETRPQAVLGPKYVVTYLMTGPSREEDVVSQDVYPYAKPGPVTYTAPGQRFWGTDATRGGWFVGLPGLKDTLVQAGLPATAPTPGVDEGSFPWTLVTAFGALGAVFAVALAALTRRRLQAAPTA
jgi:hypothetical protein